MSTEVKHIIDCGATPLIPEEGWGVVEHNKDGQLVWRPEETSLLIAREHQWYDMPTDRLVDTVLKDKRVLNANVLDYLLSHREAIPSGWGDLNVFFWGTIYHHWNGTHVVRGLYQDLCLIHWCYHWLKDPFAPQTVQERCSNSIPAIVILNK